MLDFGFLPTLHEGEVGVGGRYEVHLRQTLSQEACMAPSEPETTGENEMDSLQPSPQRAALSEDESTDPLSTGHAPVVRQSRGKPSDDTGEVEVIAVRILRSASKRQDKTVQTLKKAAADSIEGRLLNAEVALQTHQNELKNTKQKLAASRKDLKNKTTQLWRKKKDLATCKRELKESKGVIRDIRQAKNELQKTLKASEEKLSQCKDDLFSLQGVAQIPDSTISKRFELLGQHIVHWIEAEVARFDKTYPDAEPDHLFSGGEQKHPKKFLQDHPGAGEHLARHLVHDFLQTEVFGKQVYLFGLPEETARLLQKAELKMAGLDPPRDSVAVASWRSETLTALVRTKQCIDDSQQQAQRLNTTLFKKLSMALPVLFSGAESHATFYEQVLLPAVQLANAMKLSTSEYVVTLPRLLVTEFKPVTIDMLKKTKMLDSASGKHLKPDSAVVADKEGAIGKFILGLEPELCRVAKGKETMLYPGTILVELFHPLGKRVKPST